MPELADQLTVQPDPNAPSPAQMPQPVGVTALDATHFVVVTREPRLVFRAGITVFTLGSVLCAVAPSLNLPSGLAEWAKQAALSVRLGQGREPLSPPTLEIHGAPPLRSRSSVVWPWLAAVLAVTAAVLWFILKQ